MSEPIKHTDHLWLVSVFGSTEERAKAEMAERGDREGLVFGAMLCFLHGGNSNPCPLQVFRGQNNL